MTKKFGKLEIFQELSVMLARIENKIDQLQKDVDGLKPKTIQKEIHIDSTVSPEELYKRLAETLPKTGSKCIFDSLSPEDRMKPMGISCSCKKCSPYCLSGGSLMDSGSEQVWMNTFRPSGDLDVQ